jgi:hypothetical protein
MLENGERAPKIVLHSFDGRSFDLGAPGRPTVIWFSPKGGLVDEFFDRYVPAWSP